MKQLLPVLACILLLQIPSHANIYRIGYPGTQVSGVDYAYNNISAAMTAASAGDTLQLYQHYWSGSPTITVTKPLKFIGFGYMLEKNTGLQSINAPDINSISINFSAGSTGSVVSGIYGSISIFTSGISIYRTRGSVYFYNNIPLSNINIGQCWIFELYENYSSPITNLHVYNNYIYYRSNLPNSSGLYNNNVVYGSAGVSLYSFIAKNNVFYFCPAQSSNVFLNNIFAQSCTTLSGSSNQLNVNLANVFQIWSTSSLSADSSLILKPGSPALGAGLRNDSTATDIGIYGGEPGEIYKQSGIPPIPSIYQLSAPGQAATTNPYNITISVRSNN